jgi:ABC-type branched-subunit amino acid transport system substrate-binding protein
LNKFPEFSSLRARTTRASGLLILIFTTACLAVSRQEPNSDVAGPNYIPTIEPTETVDVLASDSAGLSVVVKDVSVPFNPIIGVIIPNLASPRTMVVSGEILEGIRVALDVFGKKNERIVVPELVVISKGDQVKGVMEALRELSDSQIVGVVALLQDEVMLELSSRYENSVPIISPISSSITPDVQNMFSLASVDPGVARILAQQAFSSGLSTAAIVHSQNLESTLEAQMFTVAFQELGGSVLGSFEYPVGSTFFEEQLRAVEAIMPDVLFLPVPLGDIELIAPQVTFFGLDSLGIRVFGTAGWSEEEVLNVVDTRHTDGVVTASPFPLGEVLSSYQEFLSAYGDIYQRTLPSLIPALGYDAASILLEGIKSGAQTSEEIQEILGGLTNLPGATGLLSIKDGRVARKYFVTCLQDRKKTELFPHQSSQPILMPPLPDPETDSIPEDAPDRIMGFKCSDSEL